LAAGKWERCDYCHDTPAVGVDNTPGSRAGKSVLITRTAGNFEQTRNACELNEGIVAMSGPKKPTDTAAMKGMYSNIENMIRSRTVNLILYINGIDGITAEMCDGTDTPVEITDHFSVGEVLDALERKLEEKAGTLFPDKGA
jgi:hypothetical protein